MMVKQKNAGYRMIKQKIKTQNDEGKNENKNSFYKEVKCVMRGGKESQKRVLFVWMRKSNA